jgi:hypothetical protein
VLRLNSDYWTLLVSLLGSPITYLLLSFVLACFSVLWSMIYGTKKVNFVTGYLHLCTKIHPSDDTSTSDCMQQERDKVKLYVAQEYGMRGN